MSDVPFYVQAEVGLMQRERKSKAVSTKTRCENSEGMTRRRRKYCRARLKKTVDTYRWTKSQSTAIKCLLLVSTTILTKHSKRYDCKPKGRAAVQAKDVRGHIQHT